METRTREESGTPGSDGNRRKRRLTLILGGVALVVVATIGAGLWYLFGGSAPEEVDLGSAVGEIDTETTATEPSGAGAASVDGTWAVDPSVTGSEGSGSFAGFRVDEELARGIGNTTAVGRSEDVSGTVVISGTAVESAEFTVDLTGITSDRPRRDDKIQEALGTGSHPEATFVLTEPVDLGTIPAEGETVKVDAVGDLTIHGVTKEATIAIEAQMSDGVLTIVGTTDVTFADYDVAVPESMMVISVEDHGVVEMQLYLTKDQ